VLHAGKDAAHINRRPRPLALSWPGSGSYAIGFYASFWLLQRLFGLLWIN
jgi:hypothetical protein